MPREVKAYLCAHKCGRNASTNIQGVENHEKTCWHNPERRACKSCIHYSRGSDYDDTEYGRERWQLEECAHGFQDDEGDFVIQVNCPKWQQL